MFAMLKLLCAKIGPRAILFIIGTAGKERRQQQSFPCETK
jgi:hypothetical protein